MRMFLARAAVFLLAFLLWVLALVKGAVDWLAPTIAADGYNQLAERLPAIAVWLHATQWWVPAGWAWALTIFLLWVTWPADQTNSR
jgi:hypothetical protein